MRDFAITLLRKITFFVPLLFWLHHEKILQLTRLSYTKRLLTQETNEIMYGPYSGLKIPKNLAWNSNDYLCIIAGIYESSIQEFMVGCDFEYFINIGSGDGIHINGLAKCFPNRKFIGFEKNTISQKNCQQISSINSINGLSLRNAISVDSMSELLEEIGKTKSLILCDVEGFEFSLFTTPVLAELRNSNVIIELHEFSDEAKKKSLKLIEAATPIFHIRFVESRNRNIQPIPLFQHLSDDLFMLFHSESRPAAMRYLILEPKL